MVFCPSAFFASRPVLPYTEALLQHICPDHWYSDAKLFIEVESAEDEVLSKCSPMHPASASSSIYSEALLSAYLP